MQDIERAAVRYFLDFDMSRAIDISIQDKLVRGLIEAPRATMFAATIIQNKDIGEISEIKTDHSGAKPKNSNSLKESKSDTGRKTKELWETSSHASKTSERTGRGTLFRGVSTTSALTADRLESSQSQFYLKNKEKVKNDNKYNNEIVYNQYIITNMSNNSVKISQEYPNDSAVADDEREGSEGSVVNDRDLQDDSLLFIGMQESPSGGGGDKNRPTTDQWVAREFSAKRSVCAIS
jgi:hypothetical protein